MWLRDDLKSAMTSSIKSLDDVWVCRLRYDACSTLSPMAGAGRLIDCCCRVQGSELADDISHAMLAQLDP